MEQEEFVTDDRNELQCGKPAGRDASNDVSGRSSASIASTMTNEIWLRDSHLHGDFVQLARQVGPCLARRVIVRPETPNIEVLDTRQSKPKQSSGEYETEDGVVPLLEADWVVDVA